MHLQARCNIDNKLNYARWTSQPGMHTIQQHTVQATINGMDVCACVFICATVSNHSRVFKIRGILVNNNRL